jgi:hypothetical protein
MSYLQVASGDMPASVHMNTAINQGIPPFDDAAARDAAYVGIGGPQPGMSCWLNDLMQLQVWNGSYWVPSGGRMPMLRVVWDSLIAPPMNTPETVMTGGNAYATPDGPIYNPATGLLSHQVQGMYTMGMTTTLATGANVEVYLTDENNIIASVLGSWGGVDNAVTSVVAGMIYLGPGQTYTPRVYADPLPTTIEPAIYTYLTLSYIGDSDNTVLRGGTANQGLGDRRRALHPQVPTLSTYKP